MLVYGHCGDRDGEEVMLASIVVVVVIGDVYWSLARFLGVPVAVLCRFLGVPVAILHKDLVVEWPPRTYSAAPSYMALA
jgi:hypothetical protein